MNGKMAISNSVNSASSASPVRVLARMAASQASPPPMAASKMLGFDVRLVTE